MLAASIKETVVDRHPAARPCHFLRSLAGIAALGDSGQRHLDYCCCRICGRLPLVAGRKNSRNGPAMALSSCRVAACARGGRRWRSGPAWLELATPTAEVPKATQALMGAAEACLMASGSVEPSAPVPRRRGFHHADESAQQAQHDQRRDRPTGWGQSPRCREAARDRLRCAVWRRYAARRAQGLPNPVASQSSGVVAALGQAVQCAGQSVRRTAGGGKSSLRRPAAWSAANCRGNVEPGPGRSLQDQRLSTGIAKAAPGANGWQKNSLVTGLGSSGVPRPPSTRDPVKLAAGGFRFPASMPCPVAIAAKLL